MALPLIPLGVAALAGGAGFFAGGATADLFSKLTWLAVALVVGFILFKVM